MNAAPSPLTPLQKEIAEESYRELQRMIYRIVFLFHSKYGGDLDDLLSKSHELFLLAHARHDPNRGKLTTCVYHSIYKGLRDIYRNERRRLNGYSEISFSVIVETTKENHNDENAFESLLHPIQNTKNELYELLGTVSEDCKNIVSLILSPPNDFYYDMNEYDEDDSDECRYCLFDYLQFTLHWSIDRIHKAFQELKETMREIGE